MKKYNIVGYYPKHNDYYLICLGTDDKEQMKKTIEDIKARPHLYGVNLDQVTEIKLEEIEDTPDNWWNGKLD